MSRRRLDAELVARGLARSRAQAAELVREGVVVVDGEHTGKPSHGVSPTTSISLTREPDQWVGRAALKLLHALELWPISVRGRRCLDVGASTGGFTQVLLVHGADHVTALDVGHGQLAAAVADDPRVTDLPGTNIRDANADVLGGPFDLVVCDLSFISLSIALPAMRPFVAPGGDLVVLVKPQFEVGRERLARSGVVTSAHEHRRVLRAVHAVATDLALDVRAAAPSPIKGGDGNREFLLWLQPSAPGASSLGVDAMLESVDFEEDAS